MHKIPPITINGRKRIKCHRTTASENNLKLSKLIAMKNDDIKMGRAAKPASLIIRLFSFL